VSSLYPIIKHLHMFFALISISGFMLRAFWSLTGSTMLERRWVKIAPHINDTLLLLCAFALMALLSLSPHNQPWLLGKILLLLVYIGLGIVALKPKFSTPVRAVAALAAITSFFIIAGLAFSKQSLTQLLF